MPAFDKRALLAELLARLEEELAVLERAHKATTEAATHAEAKPENDKDTRALEQSYLARGQAGRVRAMRASVAELAALAPKDAPPRVTLGALVSIDEGGEAKTLLLAPSGGGAQLAGGVVQVVTPASPLGRALLGKEVGDVVELVLAGKARAMEIVALA